MDIDVVSLTGFVAGAVATVAFVPQVIKTWKTRSTKDISLPMYVVFCIGVFLWLVYGIMLSSWPLIIANVITFLLSLTILFFKLKYK